MAGSSSRKDKSVLLEEQGDPSIPALSRKRRRSPTIAETLRRGSAVELDTVRSGSAQVEVPSLRDESDSSSYRDDISIGDSDAEKEMDAGEERDILGRLSFLPKVDFDRAPQEENKVSDGRSWMDRKVLADFRVACSVSDEVIIRLPLADERPWDPPQGYFCVYECFFSWLGMRFPIPQFFFDYCEHHKMATSQLSHSVVRHMLCCAELAKAMRIPFDADFFERVSILRAGPKTSNPFGVGMTYFSTTMKDKISAGVPISKIHDWDRYYFFVRKDAATATDSQAAIFPSWRASPGKITVLNRRLYSFRYYPRPDLLPQCSSLFRRQEDG